MARQLTLFGKLSQERSVYQVPANDYEKFVNFYVAGKFARLPIAEAKRLADGEWHCHREDKRFVEEAVRKAAAEAERQVRAQASNCVLMSAESTCEISKDSNTVVVFSNSRSLRLS